MKYRSRSEIIGMILQAANNGATKTRIMYAAYLSYAQAKEYLEFLQDKGLIRHEPGTQLYRLTERGLHFLSVFDEISELMASRNDTSSKTVGSESPPKEEGTGQTGQQATWVKDRLMARMHESREQA